MRESCWPFALWVVRNRNSEQFACMDQILPVQIPTILAQCYQYIIFLNTLINLTIMAGRVRFQLAICLPLLENATDTFIESSSHYRTKIPGSDLDCHSLSRWQGPRYFPLEAAESIMQCGQRKTSCIERTKTKDGNTLLGLRPNRVGAGRSFCSYQLALSISQSAR